MRLSAKAFPRRRSPDQSGDVRAAIEVIEHLENHRDFMRKLARLARPDGWIVVTTPNQLSMLSLATLAAKQRFQAFQDVHYPTHLIALLPGTARHNPRWLSRRWPRAFSENELLIGPRKDCQ